jgi:hypothetical protein
MTRRACLLACALLTFAPAALLAHDGHDHKIMGTVSMLHENHLEVKATDGKTSTITLDGKTKIVRGKTKVVPADIKVGDRVVVNVGNGKAPLVAKEVQLGAAATAAKQ